jgi:hypothetical protein
MQRSPAASIALAMIMGTSCRQASPPNVAATVASDSIITLAPTIDSALAMPGADTIWVRTPAGLMHRSCVHEVPSGAAVVRGDTVVLADGGRYVIPRCRFRGFSTIPRLEAYGPPNVAPDTMSLPQQPNFLAHVTGTFRENGLHPVSGRYSQLDLDVTTTQVPDRTVVIVGDRTKVYVRRGGEHLVVIAADSIVVGDELEVWHGGEADRPVLPATPRIHVYYASQVIIRR